MFVNLNGNFPAATWHEPKQKRARLWDGRVPVMSAYKPGSDRLGAFGVAGRALVRVAPDLGLQRHQIDEVIGLPA